MNCEEIRAKLEDAAEAAQAEVAEHIRGCAACAEYAAGMNAENEILARTLSREPDEKRWQAVRAGVSQRLKAQNVVRQRSWLLWACSGAAAAIAVAAFMIFHSNSGSDSSGELAANVVRLQQKVREGQLLDELEQLQIAFQDVGDEDATSVAEDAELYVMRIMSLDPAQANASREILSGIKAAGISGRLHRVRESIVDGAPRPMLTSLELAVSTLDEASRLAEAEEHRNVH